MERVWRKGNPLTLLVGMQSSTASMGNSVDSIKNWKEKCHVTQQSHCWACTLRKPRIERDTCTPVFTAALFTIARTWKQPRYPSADRWIRNLWYMYTIEYYSAIKKNTFESILTRWMKLSLLYSVK